MSKFFRTYICCCCFKKKDEDEVNERTRLLDQKTNNSLSEDQGGFFSNDEGSTLNKILNKTASNIIDVGATESYLYDPNEVMDRAKYYNTLLSKISPTYLKQNFAPAILSSAFATTLYHEEKRIADVSKDKNSANNTGPDGKHHKGSKDLSSSKSFHTFNRFITKRFKNNSISSKDSSNQSPDIITIQPPSVTSLGSSKNYDAADSLAPCSTSNIYYGVLKGLGEHEIVSMIDELYNYSLPSSVDYDEYQYRDLRTKCDKWLPQISQAINGAKIVHKEDFLIHL